MSFDSKFRSVAYGTPKTVKNIPKASDKVGNVSVRVFQTFRARPAYWGYSKVKIAIGKFKR